jgi:hypothetical protein
VIKNPSVYAGLRDSGPRADGDSEALNGAFGASVHGSPSKQAHKQVVAYLLVQAVRIE